MSPSALPVVYKGQIVALEHRITRPASRRYDPPLLLLHGAWHGAWCWERAMADLSGRGFEVHAISVRGHGASDPAGGLTTVLEYLRDVRAAIAGLDRPPVLVGHSSGGYVTQLLVTGAVGAAPPLRGAVLLCSSPVNIGAYFMSRGLRGTPMVDIRALLRRDPATVRQALFRADIADAELEQHRLRLVSEPPLVPLTSMLLRPRPARCMVPLLVLAAERDAIFDLEAQRDTARAYAAELVIVPGAAHNLMLDPGWAVAADALERFVSSFSAAT